MNEKVPLDGSQLIDRRHQRSGWASAYLGISMLISFILGAVILTVLLVNIKPGDLNADLGVKNFIFFLLVGLLNLACCGFTAAILRWKKWGYFGFFGSIFLIGCILVAIQMTSPTEGFLPLFFFLFIFPFCLFILVMRTVKDQLD
jgi:hypothetical protein